MFFANLGGASLWDVDEGRNLTCAWEMSERDIIEPTFNSVLRVDKPALLYWLQIACYQVFGFNEFAGRFPSALAALVTVLVAYELGRSLFGARTGLLGGCLVATTPMVCGAARFANPDALLNCLTCLTLALFWIGQRWRRSLWFSAVGAASGLAFFAKGPVGVVLPGGVIFLFMAWERRLKELVDRRLLLGVLAFVATAAPWYGWVGVTTKGEWLKGFFFRHNVDRFLSPMESHDGFPGFYLLVVLLGTLPWSVFFGFSWWYGFWSLWPSWGERRNSGAWRARWTETWRRCADREDGDTLLRAARYRFLVVWMLLYLLFFSVAATKLPNYVLPAVVPFCLLTARFLERWRRGAIRPSFVGLRLGLACLLLFGAGLTIGLLIVSGATPIAGMRRVYPALAPWAGLGALPIAGAALGWWLLRREASGRGIASLRTAWIGALVGGSFLFWGALGAGASTAFNRYKAARPLVEASGASRLDEEMLIGAYRVEHLPSLHFYLRRNVLYFHGEDDARVFLRYPTRVFLFVPAGVWDSWRGAVSAREAGRHWDLYHNEEIVVLTNR
ncbi:MAG: glycosyltransferase family 39 protein [Gemmataceae bacterium]